MTRGRLNDGRFEKTNIVLNSIKKKIACIIKEKKKIRETRRKQTDVGMITFSVTI